MFSRILIVGLLAGFIGGMALAAVQQLKVAPLIAAAETYETAAEPHDMAMGQEHEWEPSAGLQRMALTFLADLIVAIGFGLVLSGSFAVREGVSGRVPDAREGLLWGLAGYAAFSLAPALGLPPQPPGMVSAEIYARQAWWLGTALATCGGLGIIAFSRVWLLRLAGVVLLVLPHLVGAPSRPAGSDAVTADLAAQFVAASLVTSAVFWCVLGSSAGWLYDRIGRRGGVALVSQQVI